MDPAVRKHAVDAERAARLLPIQDAAGGAVGDDPRIEDSAAHRLKIGRWRKEGLHAVRTPLFWVFMKIGHTARAPFDHLVCFIQKHDGGNAESADVDGKLCQLVCGKAISIFREFAEPLRSVDWIHELFNGAAIGDRQSLLAMIVDFVWEPCRCIS